MLWEDKLDVINYKKMHLIFWTRFTRKGEVYMIIEQIAWKIIVKLILLDISNQTLQMLSEVIFLHIELRILIKAYQIFINIQVIGCNLSNLLPLKSLKRGKSI